MNEYNFDHPDAFDFELLIETVRKLKEGKSVDVPIYNFVTHAREKRMVSALRSAIILPLTRISIYSLENNVRCKRDHM